MASPRWANVIRIQSDGSTTTVANTPNRRKRLLLDLSSRKVCGRWGWDG